ncbi:MAG: hypothetical protein EB829_05320 [Nitrosopumilus sp. H8]|nr:MAG: hypothetical protein EB830_06000 [Nitrosopumilus sp. H13]RNJ78173.1 MAG: hypothetical protein EB829_05320 [Nitrosopumilus sp. H8]
MKWLVLILLAGFAPAAFAQGQINPSLIINTVEIPADEFNTVLREAPVRQLDRVHATSWQVTIDNNLNFVNPDGSSVFRLYDDESADEFIEVGMGAQPDYKFWVAVQTPKEGYVVIHHDLERGWYPQAKSIISYTDRAGLTVNNGARIVVTNLDIGVFAIASYSVHGLESSTDPPSVNSGIMIAEFLSGDPAKNIYSLYPFYIAAAIGVIVGFLFITKKRT